MSNIDEKGFTALEVIVAIAVGSLMLLGIITLTNTLLVVNDRAKELVIINSFVEDKVESLRSIGYSGLSDGTVDITADIPASINGAKYAEYVISTVNSSLKLVNVHVEYNDYGTNREFNYKTHIGELGVGQY